MKAMKKFISIAVGCCLALSSFVTMAEDGSFKDDVSELISYGIVSESAISMAGTDIVTRGQMVKYAVNAMMMGGIKPTQPTTAFVDVDETHPAFDAIYLAYELGIVDGNGDGTFCPDDAVTYEQAAKILVNMLGYNPMAEQRGGYPNGYIKVAQQTGITGGITFVPTDKVLFASGVQLICKAVQTPVMEQTGYGSEAVYEVMNGEGGKPLITLAKQFETNK